MSLEEMLEPRHPGEYELKKSLRANGYIVQDVSDNPNYWNKDIDLIAQNTTTGVLTSLEVKWDNRIAQTGNMYIETENPRSNKGLGWFRFCEADMLAYGDAINGIFYFIGVAALRDYIKDNKAKLSMRTCADGAYGYLVPIADLAFNCVVKI